MIAAMTRIPAAVLRGLAVLFAGNLPWVVVLAPGNLALLPAVPWAVLPMAIYLRIYWKYIGGRIGSPATAATRREQLRANPLPSAVWPLAIVSGLIGFGAILALTAIMARLIALPASSQIVFPPGVPAVTAATLLAMASLVAGVTEEAAFRGYMQGPVERRHGLLLAVLVNGTAFGLLHFPNHPDAVIQMLPYYIAVAAVYGGLTWATNSILPAVALHVGGDVWSLGRLWLTGRPEWQRSGSPAPLVWDSGLDASFLWTCALFAAFTAATVALYMYLRRLSTRLAASSISTSRADAATVARSAEAAGFSSE
jgi:membrane protease YdiL (CAAX protease family)